MIVISDTFILTLCYFSSRTQQPCNRQLQNILKLVDNSSKTYSLSTNK
ncbi:hypothetical protein AM1_0392 [Acaryochloris marina MBIC11017]|uniref:Uncharacterized protein n=1 Tax=Acaryochloris marina (strain MBIC 11017) TaxID=329726 RepID=B0CA09_ACAM1|nr:hypothetical protein AM1_0392 [Acaryochloris marina MBIC11017]